MGYPEVANEQFYDMLYFYCNFISFLYYTIFVLYLPYKIQFNIRLILYYSFSYWGNQVYIYCKIYPCNIPVIYVVTELGLLVHLLFILGLHVINELKKFVTTGHYFFILKLPATNVENKLYAFVCWWSMSELTTNINWNNNNLQYDELIGSLVLDVRARCNGCSKEICHIGSLVV